MTADADRPADQLTCASCGEVMTPDSRPAAHLRPGHGASRPADVRKVISDALFRVIGYPSRPEWEPTADVVLAALSAAGLTVVPMGEQREEWALSVRNGSTPHDLVVKTEQQARETLAADREWAARRGKPSSTLVRRTVHVGPWEPADADG